MKKNKTLSSTVAICSALAAVGFMVISIFDSSKSGKETFFQVFFTLVIGFVIFAIVRSYESRNQTHNDQGEK